MNGYELVNKDLYDIYSTLKGYRIAHYSGNANISYGSELYEGLIAHMDNMVAFQKLVDSNDKSVDLSAEAKARFDNKDVRSTVSVDSQMIARLELLLEYSESIRILFNNIVSLTEERRVPKPELVLEINEVLRNKGLDHFTIPNDLLIHPITKEEV